MRITIMGTGGVGGYFGARLAAAGCDVRFVARGAQLVAMRERGLRLISPKGDLRLPQVQVDSDPAAFGAADLVILGVKLWGTETAARAVLPVVGEDTAVVSFQSGVVKDDALRAVVGASATVPGACYIAATIAEPGVIRHTGRMHKLVFGESDGKVSARLQRLGDACAAAGVDHLLSTEIRRAVWEKFVFLASFSALTTAARAPIGALRQAPASRALLLALLTEATAVAQAEGVALPPDFAAHRLSFIDTLPPEMTSSMHEDLERGNRLELPWLSGDLLARGQRLQVPTPAHAAMVGALAVHESGRRV